MNLVEQLRLLFMCREKIAASNFDTFSFGYIENSLFDFSVKFAIFFAWNATSNNLKIF